MNLLEDSDHELLEPLSDLGDHRHTLLIVEDDPDLLFTIKEKLYNIIETDFIIETASDPAVAIELMQAFKEEGIHLSLIISDLFMPGMTGDQLLEESMRFYPEAKKILMSGDPTIDAIVHSINSANLYRMLTKPLQEPDFQLTIKQAINAFELDLKVKAANRSLKKMNESLSRIVEEKVFEIKSKNKQLTDSINYARLIQKSVLSDELEFANHIPNAFTLIMPKDIVSGDFFWYNNNRESLSYILADSTGHGVPGAFVSLLAYGAFSDAFESTIDKSDVQSIVCKANNQFKKTLNANTTKDSAEVGYLFLNWRSLELKYFGFKMPLYIVRKGEVIELCGSELIFGEDFLHELEPESMKGFQLRKGDTLFISTDGYKDQFGGKLGKKFGSKRFKAMISFLSEHEPKGYSEALAKELKTWQGNNEQIDDISIFGLSIV